MVDDPAPAKQVFDRDLGIIMQRLEELLAKGVVRNA
jgi:hypothetical protein